MQLLVGHRFPGARPLWCGSLRREVDVVGAGGRGLQWVWRDEADGSAELFFDAAQTAVRQLLHRGCEVSGRQAAVDANAWRRRHVSMQLWGLLLGLLPLWKQCPVKTVHQGAFLARGGGAVDAVPSPGRVAVRHCAAEGCAS